ncbi:MAG: 2OG-Fe(II) oxygenase [Dokdonella sp.]
MGDDFIEVYDGALDAGVCAELIRHFEASKKVVRGATGGGVNIRLKDSWDLTISHHPEWQQAENLLNTVMMAGLLSYMRRYPYMALAPVALSRTDPAADGFTPIDAQTLRAMSDQQLQSLLVELFRPGTINLQKYIADVGGYPYWHSEISPKPESVDNLHRVLLWSIYLNDGFQEGETEFFHQQRKITPRTGSLLFAPAGATHTHRGNMPKGGDKYIATSWLLFQPAQVLYRQPGAGG